MSILEITKNSFVAFFSFVIKEFMKIKHQNDLIVKIKSTVASDCETEKEEEEFRKQLNPVLKDLYKKLHSDKSDVQEILNDFNEQAKPLLQEKYNTLDCDKLCHQFDEIISNDFILINFKRSNWRKSMIP